MVFAIGIVLVDGKAQLITDVVELKNLLLEALNRLLHASLENHGLLCVCIAKHSAVIERTLVSQGNSRTDLHALFPL